MSPPVTAQAASSQQMWPAPGPDAAIASRSDDGREVTEETY